MSDSDVKININDILKHDLDRLCRTILEACKKYYSDPKNVEAYEKWKAEQDKEEKDSLQFSGCSLLLRKSLIGELRISTEKKFTDFTRIDFLA